MPQCKQCGIEHSGIYGAWCVKCTCIDGATQAPPYDASQCIVPDLSPLGILHTTVAVHGKPCDYMHGAKSHKSWADSGIPAHGMPAPRDTTKRLNVRDHSRSMRRYRSSKAMRFAPAPPSTHFYPHDVSPQQVRDAFKLLEK